MLTLISIAEDATTSLIEKVASQQLPEAESVSWLWAQYKRPYLDWHKRKQVLDHVLQAKFESFGRRQELDLLLMVRNQLAHRLGRVAPWDFKPEQVKQLDRRLGIVIVAGRMELTSAVVERCADVVIDLIRWLDEVLGGDAHVQIV